MCVCVCVGMKRSENIERETENGKRALHEESVVQWSERERERKKNKRLRQRRTDSHSRRTPSVATDADGPIAVLHHLFHSGKRARVDVSGRKVRSPLAGQTHHSATPRLTPTSISRSACAGATRAVLRLHCRL